MHSGNSKTSDPHRLLLNLTNKRSSRTGEKCIVLSKLSIYFTLKDIKKSYKNHKFKMSAPMLNDKFEMPDGSCSVSDI